MAQILVVDDSPVELKIIRRLLDKEYEVIETTSGPAAVKLAAKVQPDLILLDILMPDMNGLAVCEELKSSKVTKDIPVIFITAVSDSPEVVKGFTAGGQDYITKPFYAPELCARIKVHLALKKAREKLVNYADELKIKNNQLSYLTKELEAAAMTDFMTGLLNRRSMNKKLKAAFAEIKEARNCAALILADIDDFKHINDTYGHECGDYILKEVADTIKETVGIDGIAARWGGEEFLILLNNATLTSAQLIGEKIRDKIKEKIFLYNRHQITLTMTLGVAELDLCQGIDASIISADKAMYKGKNMSKNCVVS